MSEPGNIDDIKHVPDKARRLNTSPMPPSPTYAVNPSAFISSPALSKVPVASYLGRPVVSSVEYINMETPLVKTYNANCEVANVDQLYTTRYPKNAICSMIGTIG